MKTCVKCSILAALPFVLAAIILLILSFPTIEYYEMGFAMSRTTGDVETEKLYTAGKHAIGPDKKFKTFLKSVHHENFKLAKVSTSDKLEIGLYTHFQYFLRPHQLVTLHEKFDRYYRPILKTNALDALKNKAVYYSTREYIRERVRVENALEEAVRERLSGKCCEKDCGKPNEPICRVGCKGYAGCDSDEWGLFAYMPLFQLTTVKIPHQLSKRFENALLLHEKNEEAKLRLESAVIRKETLLKTKTITNTANVILQSATANATLIKKLASAEAKLMVENARIDGLSHIYRQLNITSEKDKTAFDYLRTLKSNRQIRLAIDFQSYIAGNLGKR